MIYIETSIPSFYFSVRSEPDMVARRDWTRAWWQVVSPRRDVVSSAAVIEELSRGDYVEQSECVDFVKGLPLLPIEPIVEEIVDRYIENHVMPRDPTGDALHLAIASYHECEFLVTWNCHHLANANKFVHIRQLNTILGLHVPIIVTPLELLGSEQDEDSRPHN